MSDDDPIQWTLGDVLDTADVASGCDPVTARAGGELPRPCRQMWSS